MSALGGGLFDDESRHLDRFGPLLVLTTATVVGMSLVDVRVGDDAAWPSVASTAVGIMIGVTLVLALRAAGIARRWRIVADVLVTVGVCLTVLLLVVDLTSDADLSAFATDGPSPIWVGIAVLTPAAVVHRLIRHRTVTAGTMYGAIAAYLLIAVAFVYAFLYLEAHGPDPFFAGASDEPTTSFMYFSLVSITTVGYGDMAPAGERGRLLATSEAVIGQVYLVTFVAMLVGLLIQQRDSEAP